MLPHKSVYRLSAALILALDLCGAASAHAGQYAYGAEDSSAQPIYTPGPSNNYVSVQGNNGSYSNPYQVPATSATSYQPVTVPGSGQNDAQYPAVNVAPAAAPSGGYAAPTQPYPASSASNYQDVPPQPVAASSYASAPANAPAPSYAPAPQYAAAQNYNSGVSGLPSFPYDRNLDPKTPLPYHMPKSNETNSSSTADEIHPFMGLETRTGIDLGAQVFWYSYDEPDASVSEDGALLAIYAKGTWAFGKGYFTEGDLRYMFGDLDYDGSGTLDGVGVDSWEMRALFGKDFYIPHEYSLSPYIGFGYRTLANDNRGTTSTGNPGYRRFNELYYIPIGVYPRTHIDSNARLSGMLEYDYLIHGVQASSLSDAGLGDPDVKNGQSTGYGIRGELMYETRSWAFGPTFTYWNIDKSKTKLATDNSAATCASVGGPPCIIGVDEPANHTFEAGIQLKYHFF